MATSTHGELSLTGKEVTMQFQNIYEKQKYTEVEAHEAMKKHVGHISETLRLYGLDVQSGNVSTKLETDSMFWVVQFDNGCIDEHYPVNQYTGKSFNMHNALNDLLVAINVNLNKSKEN